MFRLTLAILSGAVLVAALTGWPAFVVLPLAGLVVGAPYATGTLRLRCPVCGVRVRIGHHVCPVCGREVVRR